MQSWREEVLQHGLEHARRQMTPASHKLTSHQLQTLQYSPRKPPVPRPVTAPDGTSPRARAAASARTAADAESTRRIAELQSQLKAAALQMGAMRGAHEALALRCTQLEMAHRRSEDGLAKQRRALTRKQANVAQLAQSREALAAAAEGAERTRLDLELGLREREQELREAAGRELELRQALAASEAAVVRLSAQADNERQAAARLAEEKAQLVEQLGAFRQKHELTRVELLQESRAPLAGSG
jgi:chromosome segregation ATPase